MAQWNRDMSFISKSLNKLSKPLLQILCRESSPVPASWIYHNSDEREHTEEAMEEQG